MELKENNNNNNNKKKQKQKTCYFQAHFKKKNLSDLSFLPIETVFRLLPDQLDTDLIKRSGHTISSLVTVIFCRKSWKSQISDSAPSRD